MLPLTLLERNMSDAPGPRREKSRHHKFDEKCRLTVNMAFPNESRFFLRKPSVPPSQEVMQRRETSDKFVTTRDFHQHLEAQCKGCL